MHTDKELKQAIIDYAKKYYKDNKQAPTIRKIIKHFKKEKLNFTGFYKLFPNRYQELCKLANVPVPKERIERTKKAVKSIKENEGSYRKGNC